MLTGAQALVRALRAEGVSVVFGIPGTHNLPLYDALHDEPAMRVVTTRHEQGAAFMADGYARATGEIGVCLTVTGPGVTNTLTALGQAYADSSPVLLIATQVPTDQLEREYEGFHELRRSLDVVGAVTGFAWRAPSATAIPFGLHAAFQHLRSRRPRPAFIEIPLDLLTRPAGDVAGHPLPVAETPPDPEAIAAAAALLGESRQPLLYLGGGVIRAGAGRAALRLAEHRQAPVVCSPQGKGAVPEDHPLVLGSGWGAHHPARALLAQADLVLAVGTRFGPLPTDHWRLPLPANLIHIDIDPTVIGRHYPTRLGIVADARLALQALNAALADQPARSAPWCDLAAQRAARRRVLMERAGEILAFFERLRAVLPPETVLCNDLTAVCYWAHAAFPVTQPRTFHYPTGFGTLGFALPAAIGAKIARPERPVVALAGDGGFLYTGQELATAVAWQVDVVAVVFNDHAYGAVKQDQVYHYGGRTIGCDLVSPDFVRLAQAFGARGLRVASLAEVPEAVAEALTLPGPTVIEAPSPAILPPWIF